MTHVTECTNNSGKSHSGNCQNVRQCHLMSSQHTYIYTHFLLCVLTCTSILIYTDTYTHMHRHTDLSSVCVNMSLWLARVSWVHLGQKTQLIQTPQRPSFPKCRASAGLWLEEGRGLTELCSMIVTVRTTNAVCRGQASKISMTAPHHVVPCVSLNGWGLEWLLTFRMYHRCETSLL